MAELSASSNCANFFLLQFMRTHGECVCVLCIVCAVWLWAQSIMPALQHLPRLNMSLSQCSCFTLNQFSFYFNTFTRFPRERDYEL